MSLRVTLPLPPSTNELYRVVVKGKLTFRVRTGKYNKWRKEAGLGDWPGPYPPQARWSLYIDLGRLSHVRDIDNCAKAIVDLLAEQCGLSDKWLDYLAVFRSEVDRDGKCEVELVTGGWAE
jgi:hypothetical protein